VPKCKLREVNKDEELKFYLVDRDDTIVLMVDEPDDEPGDGWCVLEIDKATGRFNLCHSVGESTGLELDEHGKVVIH